MRGCKPAGCEKFGLSHQPIINRTPVARSPKPTPSLSENPSGRIES